MEKRKVTVKRRIWLQILLTVTMCLALAFAAPVSAASKKTATTKNTSAEKKKKAIAKKRKKAIAAYKKLIAEGYSNNSTIEQFFLLDIDKNILPKLILKISWTDYEYAKYGAGPYIIFSYSDDKVKEIYSTGSFGSSIYYYKAGKVIGIKNSIWAFIAGDYEGYELEYYKISKNTGKLKKMASISHLVATQDGSVTNKYKVGGKTTSKSRYTSYVKKITKNAKSINLSKKMKKNTAANRKKYLK